MPHSRSHAPWRCDRQFLALIHLKWNLVYSRAAAATTQQEPAMSQPKSSVRGTAMATA